MAGLLATGILYHMPQSKAVRGGWAVPAAKDGMYPQVLSVLQAQHPLHPEGPVLERGPGI